MWIQARENYAKYPGFGTFFHLYQFIKIRPGVTLFELSMPLIPEKLFTGILYVIRKEIQKFGVR